MKNPLRKSFTFLIIPILLLLITFLPKGLSQLTKTVVVTKSQQLPGSTVVVTEEPPVAEPTDTISIPKGPGAPEGAPGAPAPAPAGPGNGPPGGAPAPPPDGGPPGGAPPGGVPPGGAPPGGAPPGAPPPPGVPAPTPPPGAPQPQQPVAQPNSPTSTTGDATPSGTSSINLLTGRVPVPSTRPNSDGNIVKLDLIFYSVIISGLIMGVLVL